MARALGVLATHAITAITFAAEPGLAAHHDATLSLEDEGNWTWRAGSPGKETSLS